MAEIAAKIRGTFNAAYERIPRFLRQVDPYPTLAHLFFEQAPLVLVDVTEIACPDAWQRLSAGVLQDAQTRGFSLLLPVTPDQGRVLLFIFIGDSSRTITAAADS